jgi:hypothetical protein
MFTRIDGQKKSRNKIPASSRKSSGTYAQQEIAKFYARLGNSILLMKGLDAQNSETPPPKVKNGEMSPILR